MIFVNDYDLPMWVREVMQHGSDQKARSTCTASILRHIERVHPHVLIKEHHEWDEIPIRHS